MTSSCIRLVWSQFNTKTGSAQNPGRLIVGLLLTVKEGPSVRDRTGYQG